MSEEKDNSRIAKMKTGLKEAKYKGPIALKKMNAKNLSNLDHEKFLEEAALCAIFTTEDPNNRDDQQTKKRNRGSEFVIQLIGMVLAEECLLH